MRRTHYDHVSRIKLQRRAGRGRKEEKKVKTRFCRYVIMTSGHRMVVKMTQTVFQKNQNIYLIKNNIASSLLLRYLFFALITVENLFLIIVLLLHIKTFSL